jgi:hypothetical protein
MIERIETLLNSGINDINALPLPIEIKKYCQYSSNTHICKLIKNNKYK